MPEELKSERVTTMMTPSELKAVDDWSFQSRIRSRGEAIRRLIQIGLRAATEAFVPGVGPEPSREKPHSGAGPDTRDTISFGGQRQRVGAHPDTAARKARAKAQKLPRGEG